ncbi:MAG: hypothetical protein AAFR38_07660 [Planctomycetota bacterium]
MIRLQVSQDQLDSMKQVEDERFRKRTLELLRQRAEQETSDVGRPVDSAELEKTLEQGVAEATLAGAQHDAQRRRFVMLQHWFQTAEPKLASEIRGILRGKASPVDARLDRAELLVASRQPARA